jgi:nucleotide-binding universal stress UspA family protein
MYRHLLIATDGSDLAQQAVTHGLALAKELRARVTAVTVTDPVPPMVSGDASVVFPLEDYTRAAEANAARILDSVTAAAQTASVACDVVHVKDQFAAQGIFPPTHHRRPPADDSLSSTESRFAPVLNGRFATYSGAKQTLGKSR